MRVPHAASRRADGATIAAAVLLLAPIAASTLGARGGSIAPLATLMFGAALIAFAFRRAAAMPGAAWFLLLAPCYFATFLGNRPILLQPDHVFNADPFRYLNEAAAFTIQPRHIGMPVVTFARQAFGGDGIGVALLPGALAGALAIVVFFRLARRLGAPVPLAAAGALGLASTLAFWSFASLVESHVFSTLLLLLLLEILVLEGTRPRLAPLALLTVTALGFSLENLYVPLFVAAWLLGRGLGRAALGAAAGYLVLVSVLFALWMAATAARAGPGFFATWGDQNFERPAAGLSENLTHFASETWDASRLLSPREQSEVLTRTFVVGSVAQPGTPPWRYGKAAGREELLRPTRLPWLLLMLTLSGIATLGLSQAFRSGGLPRLVIGWASLLLLYRHAFIVAFSPREGLLFALPSLALGALLLCLGLAAASRSPLSETPARRIFPVVLAIGLAAAALWQAVVNRVYLDQIATPGRFGI